MAGTIRITKWDEFQHYRDRDPVWIKLHRSLLDNYEWSRLQDASKSLLVGLWLLAARHNNAIPADLSWIATRISATTPVDLQPLVDAGFISLDGEVEQVASNMGQPASPRALARGEERRGEKRRIDDASASRAEPSWPAQVAEALALVGPVAPGRIGKALQPLLRDHPDLHTHGVPLLVEAARAYARWATNGEPESRRSLKHPHDFLSRAGYWIDRVRPGGGAEQLDAEAGIRA